MIKLALDETELIQIINKGENQIIEFKETFRWDTKTNMKNKTLILEITKTACSLLNSQGGLIFIGVDDSGNIIGIERDLNSYNQESTQKNKDLFYQHIKREIKEKLGVGIINLIDVKFVFINNKEIVIITVIASNEPIFHLDKDFIVRNGPQKETINDVKNFYYYLKSHENFKLSKSNEINVKELLHTLYKVFSHEIESYKGQIYSLIREIGELNLAKFLNLKLIDNDSTLILLNSEWIIKVYSPAVPLEENFDIEDRNQRDPTLKTFKDRKKDPGNNQVLQNFLLYYENKTNIERSQLRVEVQNVFDIIKSFISKIEIYEKKKRGHYIDYFFNLIENDSPDEKNRIHKELRGILLIFKSYLKFFGINEETPLSLYLGRYIISNRYISVILEYAITINDIKNEIITSLKEFARVNFNLYLK